jgi:hypothetical protein
MKSVPTLIFSCMRIAHYLFFLLTLTVFSACSTQKTEEPSEKMGLSGRLEYEWERLKDPATGIIPENIRVRELAFATTLPKAIHKNTRASLQVFEPIGPRNFGGRTRAVAFDVTNSDIVLAGGVSGGMWRSTDFGNSWKRVTNYEDQSAVSCVIQDLRQGKTNTFYYGSGESTGNSASKSFSAIYYGSGMYKSTDHGATWTHLPSTSVAPNKGGDFRYIFNVAVDNSRSDSDIVYAATPRGIRRSNDGGATWNLVLGGSPESEFTEIVVTPGGIHYAAIGSTGAQAGFWRSTDGLSWTYIAPNSLPSVYDRTLIAYAPSNPNVVYFYSSTPNSGNSEVHFWKYIYLSGDGSGSGGVWSNRNTNLPPVNGYTLDTQGSYNMTLAVKPDNENIVFLGATNLFRSNNGFSSSSGMNQIGGYDADGYTNFNWVTDNQHPDQQSIAFVPGSPNQMLAGTDGGLHFTYDCRPTKVFWENFNNGYQTTQFYGIGIDHGAENEIVISGYQDNGSWWTNSADTNTNWKYSMGGDGSYCAKEDANDVYYFSSQFGRIRRVRLDANGDRIGSFVNVVPSGTGNDYLFNHPFTLDPSNTNRMYLPHGNDVWRNSNLSGLPTGQDNWSQIATVSGTITAISASKSSPGVVYIGTNGRKIYRLEDAGGISANVTDISSGITSGTYTSNIAIDPQDADRVIVVFSNYNVVSAWYTEDGGSTWTNVEGNLKGVTDPGVPPSLDYIGNGPSFRWAQFVPTPTGTAILMGTSIGLFGTNALNGSNTVWVQQASDIIGNVVIEQIDYRESDGFCVVGTHGAGAYKTYFENADNVTSINNMVVNNWNVKTFPNPVSNQLNVQLSLAQESSLTLELMNVSGQIVMRKEMAATSGENTLSISMGGFTDGMYYLSIISEDDKVTKAIVKQ